MKDFKQSACALLILILTNCCLNVVYASDPQVEAETVKKIKKVTTQVLTSYPPQLLVNVIGEVPSGGFTDVKLVRVSYRNPPQDGIQDYYLKAVPPTQPAIAVISEVKASDLWKGMPAWVKGVRVHGIEDGVKVVVFNEEQPTARPRMRRFKGTSEKGSYDEAFQDALAKLNQALAEDGVRDATATWKVDAVQGEVGGIAGLNRLNVMIVANRQPAWSPSADSPQKQKQKPDKTKSLPKSE